MCKRSVSTIAKLLLILMAQFLLSSPTSAKADNCCFVDRQCQKDEEWVNGYYAYQDNRCGASSQHRQAKASQSQPQTETSEAVDNCCFSGWHCNADEEWTSGYFAFQNDHCASQAHWEEQWRKRSNGNRQQRQSGNQQAESNNQPTKRDKKPRPASTEPDDSTVHLCPCPPLDRSMPGVVSVKVDLTDPNKRVIENDDGSFIIIDPDLPD